MIVVDASVAVKTYLAEPGSEAATRLLSGQSRLLAPELIGFEVCGALWRRVRMAELQPDEAESRCRHWLKELDNRTLQLIPDHELIHAAIDLAKGLQHPVADCMYLAVAQRFDAALVTADRPLVERARERFPKTTLLNEFDQH